MHAKVLIVDNEVLSVGTTNMDLRSFNHNFELNAMIYDESLAVEALAHFTEDLSHSIKLEYEEFRRRSTYKRSLESLFRLFSPLL
jgi:cardiolipin synthase